MTTVTYNAINFTDVITYDPEIEGFRTTDTLVSAVELEFVIAGDLTQFQYDQEEILFNRVLQNPDGDRLDGYEIRVDGEAVAFNETFFEMIRYNWDSNKQTDVLFFSYFFEPLQFDDLNPQYEESYAINLAGDSITEAVLDDYDGWLDSFVLDEFGIPLSSEMDTGLFQPDQLINFSDPDDFIRMSDDDTVRAEFSPYSEFDLGKGDDEFFGSDDDERVFSGKGNDVIMLEAGDDYVRVGGGREEFYGGSGNDYISYYDSSNGITANLATDTVAGSWAVNDIVEDFESISGSKTGGDSIIGTSGANTIRTYGGNDRVASGGGTDKVELGSGNDYVRVGGGAETFDGGSGKDYISYYSSANGIRIDLRDDKVSGSWAVNDTISDFESASGSKTGDDVMLGTNGANTLRSYGGDDKLYGRGGSDKLYGGDGEDFLDGGGGSGTDLLYGGAGADIFEFDRGEGVDIIKDFENNIDTINLDNFDFPFDDPFAFAEDVDGDVIFDFGSDGMLTVENTRITLLLNDLEVV